MSINLTSRDAVIEAAFQVFAETPTATLADVAKRAGVGRATLHRHFKGREDLLEALAHRALEELEAAIDAAAADAQSYGEGLRLALEATIPLANRQWFLANEPVERIASVAAAYQASREALVRDIEAAKDEGVFARDVPTGWIIETLEALTYAAWARVRAGDATPRQAADLAWRTLTHGLSGEDR